MNLNLNTSRIAAAVLETGVQALGATACGGAAGEGNDAPQAPEPALELAADQGGDSEARFGPRPSKDARLRCYPRLLANPDAAIPDRCFWEWMPFPGRGHLTTRRHPAPPQGAGCRCSHSGDA